MKNSLSFSPITILPPISRILNRQTRFVSLGALSGFLLIFVMTMPVHASDTKCSAVGTWTSPVTGKRIPTTDLINKMSKKPIVLLGETHTSAEHHRWQLQVISALHGLNPNMIIGFEAFPRTTQSALDQWVKGDLSEKEFLEKSRWFDVWKYDPDLYMPLFHFARMNRIPMRALNVERSLTRQVGQKGWAAIPASHRRGLGTPAKPSVAYLDSLKKVFSTHSQDKSVENSDLDKVAFKRFVDVQLTWDRAMAEALASARTSGGAPLVVGIVGRGHIEYGYGIPHQLDDLGISGSAILLPSDSGSPCTGDDIKVADALFGISAPVVPEEPPHPLLGIRIEAIDTDGTKAVRIIKVSDQSVAEDAGLQEGDLIVKAAGQDITKTPELVATVRSQAPGTWLPLVVIRQGERLNIIAKFPAKP